MAAKKRASSERATKSTKQMDVQLKEFQSAMAQLNDAMVKLNRIQPCVECSCGPCFECTVCKVCTVCHACHACFTCKICRVCSVCNECSCGPCAA